MNNSKGRKNIKNNPNRIEIEETIRSNDILKLRSFLKNGLDPNTQFAVPLISYAAYYNHHEMVKELLEAGADPDLADDLRGMTALIDASYKGYIQIVETLVRYTKDINKSEKIFGYTALMEAARGGELEIAKMLVEHGANRVIQGKNGSTAYDLAILKRFENLADFLRF